jgi:hypothetical protein
MMNVHNLVFCPMIDLRNVMADILPGSTIKAAVWLLAKFIEQGSSYYRILTMVYNFQKYWVFGLYPSSWY